MFPIALSILFLVRVTHAQTSWTDASGDWFKIENWSGGVPNSSTDAVINNNGTPQIALAGATAANLHLGDGPIDSGNLLVSGSGTLTSSFLAVGNSGTGTVTVQSGGALSNSSANIANLSGSNGVVLVEGPDSRWTTGMFFNVGYSGAGALTIRTGGRVSSEFGYVGTAGGSNGLVLVDGVGSVWTGSSGIHIGERGTGSLTIQNGGAAFGVAIIGFYFGSGVVLVDGSGSTLTNNYRLNVGYSSGSSGTLTIQNGAAVSDAEGYIGWPTGGRGTVLLDGAGSTWTNSVSLEIVTGSLTIQNEGAVFSGRSSILDGSVAVDGVGSTWSNTQGLQISSSTFTIQNGGAVSSDGGFIGNGSTILIDGVGSNWIARGQFEVGHSAEGSLIIRNGGKVSSNFSMIGSFSSHGDGVVLVDGVGSTWGSDDNRQYLYVGTSDTGTLNIFHGGVVSSFAAGVAVGAASRGTVTVDGVGSAWNISTEFFVGGGDNGNGGEAGGTAQLQVINDGKITATTTTIFGRGTIIDNALFVSENTSITPGGLLGGSGIVSGNVTNAGCINPGDPIGSLTITGDYTQVANGTLTIEVNGTDPNVSDHLNITGNTTIDGTLEVRFLHGLLPVSGQVIKILNVGGAFSGSFAQIIFPDLRTGFQFQAAFVNGYYQITALNDGVAATGFLNISTRMRVGTGDNALIGGFIVTGNASKKVVIRAIGPSLVSLPGRLADPTLELRDNSGGLIFSNDNWVESPQRQQIIDTGLQPGNDNEAAIVATLAPGSYTAVMRGAGNTTGIGVVDVYDLAQEVSAKLANISSRGFVETGDNVMIGGFIAGNQAMHLMVRAIGPSLTQFGIPNALTDPTLELHNSNGAMIAFNNDWRDTDQVAIEATGIPPSNNKEAAVVITLAPGSYTAIVRGLNNTTGVCLVEVYHLQ